MMCQKIRGHLDVIWLGHFDFFFTEKLENPKINRGKLDLPNFCNLVVVW